MEISKTLFALAVIGLVDAGVILGMGITAAIQLGLIHF